MPFVILDTTGKLLIDIDGELIVLATREEAARWTAKGERVEPYIARGGVGPIPIGYLTTANLEAFF